MGSEKFETCKPFSLDFSVLFYMFVINEFVKNNQSASYIYE